MDALRADHLSCYGYERETTPTIDRLASDGVVFERCFTPATWTRPVAASICTGSYPPTHGTETRHDTFNPDHPALAEVLSTNGYDTVGITSMGNVSSSVNFDRGFDEFYDLYKDPEIVSKRRTSSVTDEELKQEQISEVALPRAEDLNDAFADWIENRIEDKPFFAFIWSIEPHIPYDPPEDFRNFLDSDYDGPVDGERNCLKYVESEADLHQLKALYDGEIAYNDACLGELLEELKRKGLFDETLVVVVGDHGDAFKEHGRLTHGHAPYDELMHVPFVVRTPSLDIRDRRIEALCSLIDLYPTILDYVDEGNVPENVQGISLSDALNGGPVDGHEYVFSKTTSYDMQNTFYGIRSDEWKYMKIETPNASGRNILKLARYVLQKGLLTDIIRRPKYYLNRYRYSESEFLYDVGADPHETRNLIHEHHGKSQELDRILTAWESTCSELKEKHSSNEPDEEIDEATQEQLRQLGYTD